MADSYRLTRVEEIEREKPGFEARVKALLGERRPFGEVAATLLAEFAVEIPERTLANYWERRFNRDQMRLAEAFTEAYGKAEALIRLERAHPEIDRGELIQQLLTAGIISQQEALAIADPLKLLAEQRKRIELEQHAQEIEIDRGKLEQEKKRLEMQIAQSRQAVEESTHEAIKRTGEGKPLTITDINQIRERTFGLPPIETVKAG